MDKKSTQIHAGQKYGRLETISFDYKNRQHAYWRCRCECGAERSFTVNNLRRGRSTSCGCKRKETLSRISSSHRMSSTKIYRLWRGILSRCNDKGHPAYKDYGGRGILVCERWLSFELFYMDMGEKPLGLTIDRINNDGPYSLVNCRWASRAEQAGNTRKTIRLTLGNMSLNMAQWSRKIGIADGCLRKRHALGWTDHKILTTPSRGSGNVGF